MPTMTDLWSKYCPADFLRDATKTMSKILAAKGIQFPVTVANSPQTNETLERMNQTILSCVRRVLVETQMPKSLWA
jgi:hypothetical protein